MISEQGHGAELDVKFNHQEDEGDSEEMSYGGEEANSASENSEKYENCVKGEIRNVTASLELENDFFKIFVKS
jgi:hypothetical protein